MTELVKIKIVKLRSGPLGISFGSINTGLPKNIVQQLVEAERIPIQKLEGRKAKIANKKALVGQLTGLVQGLRTDLRANSSSKNASRSNS